MVHEIMPEAICVGREGKGLNCISFNDGSKKKASYQQ
jgi:hypothetical protein